MHAPDSNGLVLVGGGGHALVVAEAAISVGMRIAGFLDDAPDAVLGKGHDYARVGLAHLGNIDALADVLRDTNATWILAIGHEDARRRGLERIRSQVNSAVGLRAARVIHPRAIVSSGEGLAATIGLGSYIGPGAIVHSRASIGAHAIINSGAIVEHECEIGENTHIAPGAVLGGRVRVGYDTLVGLGARVLPGLSIGNSCVVGAGAVVLDDVPHGAWTVGVPAERIV